MRPLGEGDRLATGELGDGGAGLADWRGADCGKFSFGKEWKGKKRLGWDCREEAKGRDRFGSAVDGTATLGARRAKSKLPRGGDARSSIDASEKY